VLLRIGGGAVREGSEGVLPADLLREGGLPELRHGGWMVMRLNGWRDAISFINPFCLGDNSGSERDSDRYRLSKIQATIQKV